ncbi:ABC transporter substrate-binding protein [Lysinibacillus sp. BF-4]|uniref:transporter substrate-binding domain-containing protein n=1 Tax=Lysinibacillus sp. BF-4 TaxID=1473546 RepID=UPI00050722CE|nr:transporter substrate-binding domain-containing protein [Lysinibacillus sp. BF-4]KFL43330.1 ABC transporter substrate-binding protein [Lysinibacillus sp. BF-4]
MNKRFVLMIVAIFTTILLAACGSKDADDSGDKATGDDSKEFRVGMEADYPPYNWTQNDDANGAVAIKGSKEFAGGYDIAFAKKVADELGKELVIVKMGWDGLVPALQSNKIDAIMAGMSPTKERKKTIDFTDIYYQSDFVLVVRKDSDYIKDQYKEGDKFVEMDSIQAFKGAKLTGQLNTSHYDVIDQIDGVKKETAMDNFSAQRVALQSGKIDGYVSERPEGISASQALEDFTYVVFKDGFKADPTESSIAVGLRKDDPDKDKINEILQGISEEERQQIMEDAIQQQPSAQ